MKDKTRMTCDLRGVYYFITLWLVNRNIKILLDSKIRFLNIESKSYSNVIENVFEKNYYSVSYRKRRTVDSKYFV